MKLTRNLIAFLVLNIFTTIIFVTSMKYGWGVTKIEEGDTVIYETWTPLVYGAVLVISAYLFQKFDPIRESRLNLEFFYHASIYVIALVGAIYAAIIMEAFRTPMFVVGISLVSVFTLTIHFFTTKNRPKGLDSKSAFK